MDTDTQYDQITQGEEDASSFITFHLCEQKFGIDVRQVRELLVMQKITPLPNAPMSILGVVDVYGTALPVVDLKARLDIPLTANAHTPQILIVEVAAGSGLELLGVLVDQVLHVDQIPASAIQPCPPIGIGTWDSSLIEGLSLHGSDLVVLLRISRVLEAVIGELHSNKPAACFSDGPDNTRGERSPSGTHR